MIDIFGLLTVSFEHLVFGIVTFFVVASLAAKFFGFDSPFKVMTTIIMFITSGGASLLLIYWIWKFFGTVPATPRFESVEAAISGYGWVALGLVAYLATQIVSVLSQARASIWPSMLDLLLSGAAVVMTSIITYGYTSGHEFNHLDSFQVSVLYLMWAVHFVDVACFGAAMIVIKMLSSQTVMDRA